MNRRGFIRGALAAVAGVVAARVLLRSDPGLNPPPLKEWAVARGFPRRHTAAAANRLPRGSRTVDAEVWAVSSDGTDFALYPDGRLEFRNGCVRWDAQGNLQLETPEGI